MITPPNGTPVGKLRVLVCEDNEDDYQLLLLELGRHGFDVEAQCAPAFFV